jgi:sucrose phosphorylase
MRKPRNTGVILNAYPDSVGSRLSDMTALLQRDEVRGCFRSFYILPSIFNTDLDRGFSLIDYDLDRTMAAPEDLKTLEDLGINLYLDFICNHISVLSKQFQDIVRNGDASPYRDFFIDWNKFWAGHGEMTPEGYIRPDPEAIEGMFFRKPGLPLLMVRFPDGRDVPYWNTFYQEVRYRVPDAVELLSALGMQYSEAAEVSARCAEAIAEGKKPAEIDFGPHEAWKGAVTEYLEAHRSYLGQMDMNVQSPLVMDYYRETLQKLAGYRASVIRLDAFAYASKLVGRHNFLNEPETWDLLQTIDDIATPLGLELLPEIHADYGTGTWRVLAEKGYMVYDFFLPGLLIDAFRRGSGELLARWGREIVRDGIRTVNMLGCHDGIPLLDLKGLLPEEDIQAVIDTVVGRGGYVKDLHGAKNMYYQVNATYFSALGEDVRRMLLARALQLFMPGRPQVWYLDLFAGTNDYEAVRRAGAGGHKEINRSNVPLAAALEKLETPVVRDQLALLRLRNSDPAFREDAAISFIPNGSALEIRWTSEDGTALLRCDFADCSFSVGVYGPDGEPRASYEQAKE